MSAALPSPESEQYGTEQIVPVAIPFMEVVLIFGESTVSYLNTERSVLTADERELAIQASIKSAREKAQSDPSIAWACRTLREDKNL